jgi:hypothetical protein
MTGFRPVFLMLLVVMDGAAVVFAMLGGSSWEDVGFAVFLIAVLTPVKGITYRRLGGRNPYRAAALATFSWQAIGLSIDLDSFWIVMGASFAVAIVVDLLALLAMDTGPATRCFFLALYGGFLVHFLIVGFFVFQRNAAFGLGLLAVGVALFLLPAFYTDLFPEPQSET